MLKIIVKSNGSEIFNEVTGEFKSLDKDYELCLEHSLVSISKWESKWHKPFLDKKPKSDSELLDYIKCMTVSQNIPEDAYYFLSKENYKDINKYLEDPMTATTFHSYKPTTNNGQLPVHKPKEKIITSELIYYWMIENNIPVQFEKWHINRLLTLIKVCGIEGNAGNSKMNKRDAIMSNKMLNDARKAKYHTHG